MKLRRKNKKLKGMTLIECIIAMAILAITGVIVAKTGAITNRLFINTNHLNNKTQAESAIGSVRDTTKLNDYCNANSVSNGEQDVTFTVGSYAPMIAKRYSTKAADVASSKDCDTNLSDDASLQYYEFN
ncbi:MAG: prepilin-type N-terminal cleavage/methylation domain-containing protein [Oscillospiraceae bacterium]|nr:prepilin-type N-terminal cleavage/methylation domain-containing protein [Oscillospiraceae bacterium]